MGRKRGLSGEDVMVAARALADERGINAMSLTSVAERLDIATPSLYNHVGGLAELRRLLALEGARELDQRIAATTAQHRGTDALRSVAVAYRAFAKEHPGLYEALLPAPGPDDDELASAMAQPVARLAGVLHAMGADQSQAVHLIRALRSTLHGFVTLERDSGFGLPVNVDESFDTAVGIVLDGIVVHIEGRRGRAE
jgi:AcrR family transcriptional regulator